MLFLSNPKYVKRIEIPELFACFYCYALIFFNAYTFVGLNSTLLDDFFTPPGFHVHGFMSMSLRPFVISADLKASLGIILWNSVL